MIKLLKLNNMRNQHLKWTSSCVNSLFIFTLGQEADGDHLSNLVYSLSSAPALVDLASSSWESSCSLRKGCQCFCEPGLVHSRPCWTTQETNSWRLRFTFCLSLHPFAHHTLPGASPTNIPSNGQSKVHCLCSLLN